MLDSSMLSKRYEVRRLDSADADDILRLCRENTLYYQYCGLEATKAAILNDLQLTPPGVERSDKYYVGFYRDGDLAAIMDLIDGYPSSDMAFIGFFMMNAALQGKGLGTGIVQDVCAYLKHSGKTSIRLAVAEDNPQANHFWKKNGFRIVDKAPMDGWTALVAEKTL